ncbi:MAG TPA: hypothetical protein DDY22_19545 [Geobacter sp.]|nr:hypothetical protein [Geobacter sp.]
MRAKMRVIHTKKHSDTCEELEFSAVCKNNGYPADGSDENNSFAMWTPSATLKMSITNPALVGEFIAGQTFYVDFTLAE